MWPDEYEYAKANMTKFNLQEKIKSKLIFFLKAGLNFVKSR